MKPAALLLLILCGAASSFAQNSILRGVVSDGSGAVVPNATVTLSGPGGVEKTATTGGNGAYVFVGLPTGDYAVQASAPQLVLAQAQALTIRPGTQTLNLRLMVASTVQQIVVEENAGPTVSTDAASNATATVLTGDDLNSLSDDPEDLQADLQALAGPSAGPGGRRDLYRWIQQRRTAAQGIDSRNSHQPKPLLAGIRPSGPGPDRDPHQAGNRQISRLSQLQLCQPVLEFTQSLLE